MNKSMHTITEHDLIGRWTAREEKLVLYDFDVDDNLIGKLTDRINQNVVADGKLTLTDGEYNTKTIKIGDQYSLPLFQLIDETNIVLRIDDRGVKFRRWYR